MIIITIIMIVLIMILLLLLLLMIIIQTRTNKDRGNKGPIPSSFHMSSMRIPDEVHMIFHMNIVLIQYDFRIPMSSSWISNTFHMSSICIPYELLWISYELPQASTIMQRKTATQSALLSPDAGHFAVSARRQNITTYTY